MKIKLVDRSGAVVGVILKRQGRLHTFSVDGQDWRPSTTNSKGSWREVDAGALKARRADVHTFRGRGDGEARGSRTGP